MTNPTYVYAGGVNTASYSHTGRSAATTYHYKIKAEGNPDSTWTAVASATTTPSALAATATSSSAISLTWTGNGSNASILGYTIAYATSSSFSAAAYQYVAGNGTTSFNHTGLYAGTKYYYKIKAEGTSNAYDSAFTSAVNATTTSAAPSAPSGLAASVISSSRIDLSWIDNSSNETGFELKRATDSAFTQDVVWIGGIPGTSYSNTGLSASTTYYYKVRAQGAAQDSAYSSPVSATTNPSGSTIPNPPSGLTATASGTQVNLGWTDNSTNETGFELKRATDSGFTQNVVWKGGIQGTIYADTGLSPGTTYHYKVRAEGAAGKSAYSSAVSVTTDEPSGSSDPLISPHFFGINAWMPRRIGARNYNGKLESKWQEIQDSGVRIMRYGGNGVDQHADPMWRDPDPGSTETTFSQYLTLVDAMRSRGIEPVLQVPVYGGKYTASQAAEIVAFINGSPNSRGVKYWSIGNEPDLNGSPYQPTSATEIAEYIRSFSSAMKAVDPSIKILGPEITWYDESIIDPLTTCLGTGADITGTDPNGRYYVDIISFHLYGFGGTQEREDVILKLMATGGFDDDLGALQARLANCHGRTGDDAIRIAVTEANVNYTNPGSDGPGGVGANSFLGGQFWAELMGIAMRRGVDFVTFWSTIEGNELGYIGHANETKKPSYYHFQMMAQSFRGYAVEATDHDQDNNVKVFAAEDSDQIAVMILNQDDATSFPYTVRLDDSNISGTSTLKINIDAGVSAEHNGTIASESSIALIFDASGAIKRKIEYKLHGHADATPPSQPTVVDYE